jgi:hypothetical protein
VVVRGQYDAGPFRRLDHLADVVHRHRQRFLAQHVQPAFSAAIVCSWCFSLVEVTYAASHGAKAAARLSVPFSTP